MRIDLKPVTTLNEDERAALKALTTAVYPPNDVTDSQNREIQWAPPDYSVLVFSPEGELVSHVGIVIRIGTLDGVAIKIGGVGSVKTHPRARGHGYASGGLRRAANALHDDHQVAFSLLVCRDPFLPFYGRLGWLPFTDTLRVEQPTGSIVFNSYRPMVLAGLGKAPQHGTIDLKGLPW